MTRGTLIEDKLIIQSQIDAIAGVRHWAVQHARQAGFDSEAIFGIELAVGEALTNIIRHAYRGQAGHEIHLSLTIDETRLHLTILDFGHKFDPADHPPPNLEIPSEGGYGVYLIEKVMDEVTYHTSLPQGTRLELVKYLPRSAGE